MATQLSDMSLGGSGFAAGYTPIRFAPLVSLTGPITAPAPPAAPEAPMARPPMLPMNQIGGYEGMGPAFTGDAIGEASRMGSPAGRRAELANLANAAGFLTSPFGAMAAYALTGQSPAQMFGVGDFRAAQGAPQRGLMPEGGLSGIFGNLSNWFSQNVFGPEQYPLNARQAPVETAIPSMVFDGGMYSVTPELSSIGQTNAIFNDPAFYNAIAAGVPMEQIAAAIGISPAAMAQMAADAIAVNPISGGGQIASSPISGGESMGSYGEGSFTGGGWSPGDVAGAISTDYGFE